MSELALNLPPELLEKFAARVAEGVLERLPREAAEEPWHLLNLEEAAARLGRSTRWVRQRAKEGELAHVRLDGGALAFRIEDLQAFAEERLIACRALACGENSLQNTHFSQPPRFGRQKAAAH